MPEHPELEWPQPVEAEIARRAASRRRWLLAITLYLAAFVYWLSQAEITTDYPDVVEHYKYGSIGSEPVNGIPYWVWRVLPQMFPQYLPEGARRDYTAFGFVKEPGRDLPAGFTKLRKTLVLVGMNCATCHIGTVRATPDSEPSVIPGMPSHTVNLQGYAEFLSRCVRDERFTVGNVMAQIDATTHLNPVERVLYRAVIPRVREGLLFRAKRLSFLEDHVNRTPSGHGRIDTFNPYKALQFNFPNVDKEPVGVADFPAIWDQELREGLDLHWDGNNDSVEERNRSAAVGAGVTAVTLDRRRMKRIEDWLWRLPAPSYTRYVGPIDGERARQGKLVYDQLCRSCHDRQDGGKLPIVPLAEIGTDPERLHSYTDELRSQQYTLFPRGPERFRRFRKTHGYASMPLDGIWSRAPYLHNGSVPTLRDLLNEPAQRPRAFYRGNDLYDPVNVGFVSDQPSDDLGFRGEESRVRFTWFDTTRRANSNAGHRGWEYGTELPAIQKEQLLEYLKTL